MAGTRKTPAKKPAKKKPVLGFVDGYWYSMDGTQEGNVNLGRNKRYAEKLFAELHA